MKSKSVLFPALDKFFNTDKYTKLGLNAVRNETYGRTSCIYIDSESKEQRDALERFLFIEGFKVNFNYWPGSKTSEVQVSYFKGNRWDV